MLKSEQNTRTVERAIRSAAVKFFGRGRAKLVFEHGHWWAIVDDGETERTFDVVDAEGPGSVNGFDFEEV